MLYMQNIGMRDKSCCINVKRCHIESRNRLLSFVRCKWKEEENERSVEREFIFHAMQLTHGSVLMMISIYFEITFFPLLQQRISIPRQIELWGSLYTQTFMYGFRVGRRSNLRLPKLTPRILPNLLDNKNAKLCVRKLPTKFDRALLLLCYTNDSE